jgi:acetyltransferase-like isoleucine patch superfamily enzyme
MNIVKKIIFNLLYRLLNSPVYKKILFDKWNELMRRQLNAIGDSSVIPVDSIIKNPRYISIGSGFSSLHNLRIEAWDGYMGEIFSPQIIIGNNVSFNTDIHIGCINKIIIGNNVLMASRIYISDHSHGKVTAQELTVAPVHRQLYSKGPVIIEDNVWIGENVSILPGVIVGTNAIVGANSVVTRDVPANSVVAGSPARVIKMLA